MQSSQARANPYFGDTILNSSVVILILLQGESSERVESLGGTFARSNIEDIRGRE